MRLRRVIIVFACVILVVCVFAWLLNRGWRPVEQTLADGTIVRIEAATYGQDHRYSESPADKLLRLLARAVKPLAKKVRPAARFSTASDSLVLWLNIQAPNNWLRTHHPVFWVEDEHGCRFRYVHWNDFSIRNGRISGVAFMAFPRNHRHFALGAGKGSNVLFLITNIPNPFYYAGPKWEPQPIPQVKTNGGLVVRLEALTQFDDGNSMPGRVHSYSPVIRPLNPMDARLWQRGPAFFCDALGNRLLDQLCTNEPAWKIQTEYYRKTRATFAPNEIWSIPKLVIPPTGVTNIMQTNVLEDALVKVLTFQARHSDRPTIPPDSHALRIDMSCAVGSRKILVRATDDQGSDLVTSDERNHPYFTGTNYSYTFNVHLLTNSTSVNLDIIVQKPVTFEFFVAPPDKPAAPF
jgi:hypothetical protein